MAAFRPPSPPLGGSLVRLKATIHLEVEAASPREAHNALVEFLRHGREFDHLLGARCVRWNGVRVWEPRADEKKEVR